MPEHKLTPKERTFIVTSFAMFETPTDIRAALKENFGVEISLPAVTHYNPDANKTLGKKYREMFDKAREQFIADTSQIAIANKAFRLRELDKHYRRQLLLPRTQLNPVELRATLEQAAKESDGGYSNKRELTGAGGQPLVQPGSAVVLYLPDNGRGDADKTAAANVDPGVIDDTKKL